MVKMAKKVKQTINRRKLKAAPHTFHVAVRVIRLLAKVHYYTCTRQVRNAFPNDP